MKIIIIGDGKVRNGTVYLNGELPIGESATFYFNGGIQNRDASSAASSLSVGTTSAQARWSLSRNNSRKSASKYPSSTFSRRLAKTSSKRR